MLKREYEIDVRVPGVHGVDTDLMCLRVHIEALVGPDGQIIVRQSRPAREQDFYGNAPLFTGEVRLSVPLGLDPREEEDHRILVQERRFLRRLDRARLRALRMAWAATDDDLSQG